jgi:hypothetical protein
MNRASFESLARGLLAILFLGAVVGEAACGGGSSSPDAVADAPSTPDGGPGVDTGSTSPFCTDRPAASGVTDLTGVWVARATGAEVVNAPIVGVMHNQTELFMLLRIAQQGAALTVDGSYCDRVQVNPPTAIAPVTIPPAWAHTETPIHRTGTFQPGTDGAWVMTFTEVAEAIGWEMLAPTDTVPTLATDQRVFDQDLDGKPGITVTLSGQSLAGSLYTVQLQKTSISAIAVTADRVEGALAFTTTQNVLASDPSSLAALYAMGSSGADPVLCNSGFVMVKVGVGTGLGSGIVDGGAVDAGQQPDGGGLGCDWVRANETILFP